MYEAASEDTFKLHKFEAKAFKWLRNIGGLGGLALTTAINYSELTPKEHVELTGGGIAASLLWAWTLEKERKKAVHDSNVTASLATVQAEIHKLPIPEWAEGNTGNILRPHSK
jgi:hypothetical protein